MPTFLFLKMNGQRSETGLNWCSADWEKGRTRDTDCRCDGTNTISTTATQIGAGTRLHHHPHASRRGRAGERPTHRDCCKRTGSGERTRDTGHRACSSPCVSRDPRCLHAASAGMAGRLSAGTVTTPNWRKPNGIHHHRHHPRSKRSELGALVSLQKCLALTWMSSRVFSGGWMVYLLCYLIFLSSGWSLSQALEDTRQSQTRSDGTTSGVKTVQDYLQKNFPGKSNKTDDMWSGILSDSHQVKNRVRLGRAGGKYASTNYMRMIDKESARASCQPRDTVLDSYEELNIPKGYDTTKVFPECIVVRRCKNGGCCRDDQECEARSNGRHNVSKLFLINSRILMLPIVEDTECECVEKPDFCSPPETDCPNDKTWSYGQCGCICRNRCPKPFLQDEATCACDCLMNNRVCKNIQRGRKDLRLSAEECDCVKGGVCRVPNCVNGRFSNAKCKCVQQDNN